MTGLEDRNEPGGPAGFARWIRLRPFAMGCRLGPCTAAAVLIEFSPCSLITTRRSGSRQRSLTWFGELRRGPKVNGGRLPSILEG